MDMKKTKVSSIILMEVLNEELSKVIENEIDKGESGDYTLVDLLIELVEVLGISVEALEKGIPNLLRHLSNIKDVYHLPCAVALNKFPTDTDREVEFIIDRCRALGVNVVLSDVWAKGGEGGVELAREVVRL